MRRWTSPLLSPAMSSRSEAVRNQPASSAFFSKGCFPDRTFLAERVTPGDLNADLTLPPLAGAHCVLIIMRLDQIPSESRTHRERSPPPFYPVHPPEIRSPDPERPLLPRSGPPPRPSPCPGEAAFPASKMSGTGSSFSRCPEFPRASRPPDVYFMNSSGFFPGRKRGGPTS